MAAPDSSQIILQTVQNSFVQLKGLGPAEIKEIEEGLQDVLKSRFPDRVIHFVQHGETGVVRENMSIDYEQRIPGSYPPFPLASGEREINMTKLPQDGLELHQYLPAAPAAPQIPAISVAEVTEENKQLKESLEHAVTETTDLTSKLNKVKREKEELGRQQQTHKLKIRKLNEIILNNSNSSDEPLDDEFLQDMFKVRNMTTDIVRRFYPGEATFRTDRLKRLSTSFHFEFYEQEIRADKNPERRRRLLISLLFLELQSLFFGPNARRFGLPVHMEGGFQELERAMEASTKVSTEESAEWRADTVSYAGRLNLNQGDVIENFANHLFNLLRPMNLEGKDNSDTKEISAALHRALRELCIASLRLSLRFRSSKTKYEFKSYSNGTSLSACDERRVKILSSEGQVSRPMDRKNLQIFCTLFGALVKTRPLAAGVAGEPIVLEAGQVVVYEIPSRGPYQ